MTELNSFTIEGTVGLAADVLFRTYTVEMVCWFGAPGFLITDAEFGAVKRLTVTN